MQLCAHDRLILCVRPERLVDQILSILTSDPRGSTAAAKTFIMRFTPAPKSYNTKYKRSTIQRFERDRLINRSVASSEVVVNVSPVTETIPTNGSRKSDGSETTAPEEKLGQVEQ